MDSVRETKIVGNHAPNQNQIRRKNNASIEKSLIPNQNINLIPIDNAIEKKYILNNLNI